jgi:ribosomal protein S18 acetylase RimI-like enzyme
MAAMIAIRAATPGDVNGVLALWHAAEAEPTHTDDPDSLRRLLGHDAAALLVAEEDGDILGTVIAAWDGWRGSIYRLVVAPDRRRRGLGRALLVRAQRRLADVGATRLQAIVVATDGQATSFWQSTGWSQQPHRLRFVRG